jgi:hypothetical protein
MSNKKAIKILNEMIKENKEYPDNDYNSWFRVGLWEAKERIEALPDEWISVSEKLPDDSYWYVLCYIKYLKSLWEYNYIDILTYNKWLWSDGKNNYNVTHWMPLPPIPKQ